MDHNPNGQITKDFIKQLPIRVPIEEFKVGLRELDYETEKFAERMEELSREIANLPPPCASIKSSPARDATSDFESDEHEGSEENRVVGNTKMKMKKAKDDLKPKSVLMLEDRISAGQEVYAMLKPNKPWVKCTIMQIRRKFNYGAICKPRYMFKLKTANEQNPRIISVERYAIALIQEHGDMLRVTKRVIAGLTKTVMMPGIIGQEPSDMNHQRYMVFMDDGSATYFKPDQVYPIFGQSEIPWKDPKRLQNLSKDTLPKLLKNETYLSYYYRSYPKRFILRISEGDEVTILRNESLVSAEVVSIDDDTMRVLHEDGTEESIYRGSPKVSRNIELACETLRNINPLENFNQESLFMWMMYYANASKNALNEEIYRNSYSTQRATKSTAAIHKKPSKIVNLDNELVFEERQKQDISDWDIDRFEEWKMHKCTPECLNIDDIRTETSIKHLVSEFRDISDLKVPLLYGWKRTIYKFPPTGKKSSGSNYQIAYEAPCGKMFKSPQELKFYLTRTDSIFDIDYFSFERALILNRNVGEVKAFHFVPNIAVDSQGRPLENKSISLINQFTEEQLAFDFEYRSETHPHSALVNEGFSFNEEFKSGCDCEGDCKQGVNCQCHINNEENAGIAAHLKGSLDDRKKFKYKRLMEQVTTGIFECNSFCLCSKKCPNRVVQNGMRFRLQVRKTLKKGWGVVALDDIPAGAFICTYSAELLDDADQYGDSDMYYADLDFITINEQQKEGYESDKSDEGVDVGSNDDSSIPEPEPKKTRNDDSDKQARTNQPSSNSRYPKRKTTEKSKQKEQELLDRVIKRVPFLKLHQYLESHDYTLDARVTGNVGRFFNHSCDPNTFVQNVFIRTQDLRFPEVAFFALKHIKAYDEITWNYNYTMGQIPGRRIDCHCGAPNCRGRIL